MISTRGKEASCEECCADAAEEDARPRRFIDAAPARTRGLTLPKATFKKDARERFFICNEATMATVQVKGISFTSVPDDCCSD